MNSYTIKKAGNEPVWAEIPVLEMGMRYLNTVEEIKAFAQICYNEKGICVHLWSENDDVRAVEKGPLGAPYQDSCLEFFFCPMENDERYFNIEFNSNGCMYLGFGRNIDENLRLINKDGEKIFSPEIKLIETGWEIFYTVPFSFIRRFFPTFEITKGKTIRANCYKCADLSVPPNYLSWSRVIAEPFTFHTPSCFGEMKFEV